MMIAVVGGIPYVTGRRMAMVPTGPIPGRTPIRVPTKTPRKQNMRLSGCKATLNPAMKLAQKSIDKKPLVH
jgi:hypothetical protein